MVAANSDAEQAEGPAVDGRSSLGLSAGWEVVAMESRDGLKADEVDDESIDWISFFF